MKTLTVITTTFNRAYCLHRLYESLLRQTSDDFVWLIVDDGSSDGTKGLVDGWKAEKKIDIDYYYKSNGGMHTARNLAYKKVETQLNVIIDSDDWMTDDAVEKIVAFWKKNSDKKYAGIVSNNITASGNLIGTALPNIKSSTLTDLFGKHKVKGDKKLIYRSDLTLEFPYPEFENENYYPASYKFRLLDLEYEMLIMNQYTCVVNYNTDSMTNRKLSQYRDCCNGFSHYRNEMIRISKSPKYIIRQMIHYIAESKMAKKKGYISGSSKPIIAAFCFPIGILYYIYIAKLSKK